MPWKSLTARRRIGTVPEDVGEAEDAGDAEDAEDAAPEDRSPASADPGTSTRPVPARTPAMINR
ncbi:hypothetical protein GCM10017673_36270 [Streptosporangium violaceochromogenes]|nr:hypothetical protein GCM10017673_36270 [Streptosporangium violaceochromogenes]